MSLRLEYEPSSEPSTINHGGGRDAKAGLEKREKEGREAGLIGAEELAALEQEAAQVNPNLLIRTPIPQIPNHKPQTLPRPQPLKPKF